MNRNFTNIQTAHDNQSPPDDAPDYLEGKPVGFCPWCDHDLKHRLFHKCRDWDNFESESTNRARYVAECEADAKIEEKIARIRGSLEAEY